jgi:hypothetical protein
MWVPGDLWNNEEGHLIVQIPWNLSVVTAVVCVSLESKGLEASSSTVTS